MKTAVNQLVHALDLRGDIVASSGIASPEYCNVGRSARRTLRSREGSARFIARSPTLKDFPYCATPKAESVFELCRLICSRKICNEIVNALAALTRATKLSKRMMLYRVCTQPPLAGPSFVIFRVLGIGRSRDTANLCRISLHDLRLLQQRTAVSMSS